MTTDRASQLETLTADKQSRRRFLGKMGAGALAIATAGTVATDPAAAATEATTSSQRLRPSASGLGTITCAYNSVVSSLDAVRPTSIGDEAATANAIEALLVYDQSGRLVPGLAKSWSQPGPTTIVYQIRDNVRFWDGSLMTMEDVLYSIDRLRSGKGSVFVGYMAPVAEATQTGPWELTLKLTAPTYTFIYISVFMFITQKKYTEANQNNLGTPSALGMATGPYRYTGFVPGSHVTFGRFDDYWGGRPSASGISFQTITDPNAQLLAMRSGAVNAVFTPSPSILNQYKGLSNAHIIAVTSMQMNYLSLACQQHPWSDIHVRRALAHCFDKPAFVKSVLQGNAIVENAMEPVVGWINVIPNLSTVDKWYSKIPQYPFNLKAAARELKQSSVPHGFKFKFPVPSTGYPDLTDVALVLAQNAAKIGIQLEVTDVTQLEWISYESVVDNGIQVIKKGPTIQDPSDFPNSILRAQKGSLDFNTAHYDNATMNALLKTQRQTRNLKSRAYDLRQVLNLAALDVPYIPLYSPLGTLVLDKSLNYAGFNADWWVIQPWGPKFRKS